MKRGKTQTKGQRDQASSESGDSVSTREAQVPRKKPSLVPSEEPQVTTTERPRTRATTQLAADKQPGTSFTREEIRRRVTSEGGSCRTKRRTEAELLACSAQEAGYGPILQSEATLPIEEVAEQNSPRSSQNRSTPVTVEEMQEAGQSEPLRVPHEESQVEESEEEQEEDTSSTSSGESLPPDPHFSSLDESKRREEAEPTPKAESSTSDEEDVFVEAEQEVGADSSNHQQTEGEAKAEQQTSPPETHGRTPPYDSFEQVTPPPVRGPHATICPVPPPSNVMDGAPDMPQSRRKESITGMRSDYRRNKNDSSGNESSRSALPRRNSRIKRICMVTHQRKRHLTYCVFQIPKSGNPWESQLKRKR